MLRSLLAFALLTSVATTAPVSPPVPPTDLIARLKFPVDNGKEIDALAMVNRAINGAIQYQLDKQHYGLDDLWVMFPADAKGDCEDYALTKLGVLSEAGFPIVTNAKLITVLVHHRARDGVDTDGHAILAVRLPSGAVAYLDNNNDEPMTRAELVAQGYQFFDWKA